MIEAEVAMIAVLARRRAACEERLPNATSKVGYTFMVTARARVFSGNQPFHRPRLFSLKESLAGKRARA